jgi:hypothetical protein
MTVLRRLAPGLHVLDAPQRFLGLELGTTMTVFDLDGQLLVHSPVAVPPCVLRPLGDPRWALAPNLMHHLYVGPWLEAGLEGWAAPGLPQKRPDLRFAGVIDGPTHPFGPDIVTHTLRSFAMTNEVLVLHRPSRTLVVTDLVFNIGPTAPWLTRVGMRCVGGYPGCRVTVLERFGMNRAAAREDLAVIAGWDFDRVVMAHGEVIETGAKQSILNAFRWLGGLALPE